MLHHQLTTGVGYRSRAHCIQLVRVGSLVNPYLQNSTHTHKCGLQHFYRRCALCGLKSHHEARLPPTPADMCMQAEGGRCLCRNFWDLDGIGVQCGVRRHCSRRPAAICTSRSQLLRQLAKESQLRNTNTWKLLLHHTVEASVHLV